MYNWGERQARADYLIQRFRANPEKVHKDPIRGEVTYAQLAEAIEQGTDQGREVVAVAGLVFTAVRSDPKRFGQDFEAKHSG